MATIEVSTWAQLRSAITSADAGDVIKLIADIDCNNEIPEGVASKITIEKTITIDGSYTENGVIKNHEIRNLRTQVSSPVEIFRIYASTSSVSIYPVFKNIDFVNLILDAPLFSQSSPKYFTIRNCRFTGKRTHNLIIHQSGGYGGTAYMYSSYFNIPYYGADTNDKVSLASAFNRGTSWPMGTYAHYCRFKETYTGTWIPSTNTDVVCCGVSNIWLNGCRVEGTIVNGYSAYFHISGVMNAGTPSMQNVYDVDFKLTSNASENVVIHALKGVVKIPVRKYSDDTPYGVSSYSTGVIPATESQMKDIDWLIQHNFDVVPSNV